MACSGANKHVQNTNTMASDYQEIVENDMAQCEDSQGHYYYLLCDSNGWELGDSTRLRCQDELCIDLAIELEVGETLIEKDDRCLLIKTNACNEWGEKNEQIGTYAENLSHPPVVGHFDVEVGDTARFYGDEPFTVHYGETGRYRVQIYRARAALSIFAIN